MRAARLHAYHEPLKLDEVDEPKAKGPLDVVVRIDAVMSAGEHGDGAGREARPVGGGIDAARETGDDDEA